MNLNKADLERMTQNLPEDDSEKHHTRRTTDTAVQPAISKPCDKIDFIFDAPLFVCFFLRMKANISLSLLDTDTHISKYPVLSVLYRVFSSL